MTDPWRRVWHLLRWGDKGDHSLLYSHRTALALQNIILVVHSSPEVISSSSTLSTSRSLMGSTTRQGCKRLAKMHRVIRAVAAPPAPEAEENLGESEAQLEITLDSAACISGWQHQGRSSQGHHVPGTPCVIRYLSLYSHCSLASFWF